MRINPSRSLISFILAFCLIRAISTCLSPAETFPWDYHMGGSERAHIARSISLQGAFPFRWDSTNIRLFCEKVPFSGRIFDSGERRPAYERDLRMDNLASEFSASRERMRERKRGSIIVVEIIDHVLRPVNSIRQFNHQKTLIAGCQT